MPSTRGAALELAPPRGWRPSDRTPIEDTAEVFSLLSDPGRLRLLVALIGGELPVGELSDASGLSRSATSHALRLLRARRVVAVRRSGRMAYYRLQDAHVERLLNTALEHSEHAGRLAPGGGGAGG